MKTFHQLLLLENLVQAKLYLSGILWKTLTFPSNDFYNVTETRKLDKQSLSRIHLRES